MRIVAHYSFNGGLEAVGRKYPILLAEVESIISDVDAHSLDPKISEEARKKGKELYDPKALNKAFKEHFIAYGWTKKEVQCDYEYTGGYTPSKRGKSPTREMDFVKEQLGIEVQFGKYSFMVYNICAKMTIFHNLGCIDTGIEIVPCKSFADQMSSGVSYYEQIKWDLKNRGVSNIDIPVLILGIDV